MIQKVILLLTIIGIQICYSSDVSFMPNFAHEPEKWHLLLPFIFLSIVLLINFIWNLINAILKKEKVFTTSLFLASTIISFLLLNETDQLNIDIGYICLFLTQIIVVVIFKKEMIRKINHTTYQ